MYKVEVSGVLIVSIIVAVVAFSSHAVLAKPAVSFTNVQVNQAFAGPFPTNKQNEPSLAQNPTNPLNLIAGSNDEIGEPACTNTTPSSCPFVNGISVSGFYASFDGGQTWPCQGLIDLSAFHEFAFGDPWQAFDSKGNAYFGTLAFPFPPTTEELATGLQADFFVAKSTLRLRSSMIRTPSPPMPTPAARSTTTSTLPGRSLRRAAVTRSCSRARRMVGPPSAILCPSVPASTIPMLADAREQR